MNTNDRYVDDNPKTAVGLTKPSLSKVPPAAVIYMALAMMDGAKKYAEYNWRTKKVTASIYIDAMDRHVKAWFDGENNAGDSGVPHLAHAMACLAILVDALETGNLVDDRPPPGAAAKLLARYTNSAPPPPPPYVSVRPPPYPLNVPSDEADIL